MCETLGFQSGHVKSELGLWGVVRFEATQSLCVASRKPKGEYSFRYVPESIRLPVWNAASPRDTLLGPQTFTFCRPAAILIHLGADPQGRSIAIEDEYILRQPSRLAMGRLRSSLFERVRFAG
jgi:hypothetical protein